MRNRFSLLLLLLILSITGFLNCNIYIQIFGNEIPVANAGSDQTVSVDETVYLNGSNSYDTDNDKLSFLWFIFDDGQEVDKRLRYSARWCASPGSK